MDNYGQWGCSLSYALNMLGARKFNKFIRDGVIEFIADDQSSLVFPYCDLDSKDTHY